MANKKSNPSIANVLIKTYGLFWKREDVFWGRPKKSGNLFGIPAHKKKANPIDFREQTGIYVLYADYKIVYIGQAGNGNAKLFTRLKKHCNDDLAGRWNQFSWFGLKYVLKEGALSKDVLSASIPRKTMLNHIEAILIDASEPPLNRQGGRWGQLIKQYLQHRDDENLGYTDKEILRKLEKKIMK